MYNLNWSRKELTPQKLGVLANIMRKCRLCPTESVFTQPK